MQFSRWLPWVVALSSTAAPLHGQALVQEARVVRVWPQRSIQLALPGWAQLPAGARLLLGTERPLGWVVPPAGAPADLTLTPAFALPADLSALRAWLVRPLTARDWTDLPEELPRPILIDSVGPAGQNVWLASGGLPVGRSLWLRVGGQPVATFDVRLAEPTLSFARARALAADLTLRPGQAVALWPSPADERRGIARSGIVFIEDRGDARFAWIAAPPHARCPPEPRVDFWRAGRFVGTGVVERRDERFWYVRLNQPAVTGPVPLMPTSRLAGDSADETAESHLPRVLVGDDARVRTIDDIEAGRLAVHVIELQATGAVLSAGEADRVRVGQSGRLLRGGAALGSVIITRVQTSYAIAHPADSGLHLALLDEVRFESSAAPPPPLAEVRETLGGGLVLVQRVESAPLPIYTPLLLQRGDDVGAAAIVVHVAGETGYAVVLPETQTREPAPGDRLFAPGSRSGS